MNRHHQTETRQARSRVVSSAALLAAALAPLFHDWCERRYLAARLRRQLLSRGLTVPSGQTVSQSGPEPVQSSNRALKAELDLCCDC